MPRWFDHVNAEADHGVPTISATEVARHDNIDDCWVIFRGHIYDLTSFVLDHPGGEDLVLQFAGKDLGDVLDDPIQHVHSNSAYLLLEEYLIGQVPPGYVAAPITPLPAPAAPVAGRAAGAIFSHTAPEDATPDLTEEPPMPIPSRDPFAPTAETIPAPAALSPVAPATPVELVASVSPAVAEPSRATPADSPPSLALPLTTTTAATTTTATTATTATTTIATRGMGLSTPPVSTAPAPTRSPALSPSKPETGRPFASLGWGALRSKDKNKTARSNSTGADTATPPLRPSPGLSKLEPLAANLRPPLTRQLGRKTSLLPRW